MFRNGEHVFKGFRRYVHWATERVVQCDDDNEAGRENDRQNSGHREMREPIGATEEEREADRETGAREERDPNDLRHEPGRGMDASQPREPERGITADGVLEG